MRSGRVARLVAAGLLATSALGAETLAIRGGRVHTLAGPPLDGATVLVEDGRIVAVGTDVAVPEGARIVDATGLEVYPGLFDALDRLGLTEIGAVAATNDFAEIGPFRPQLRAMDAVHPASEHIPVARANGLTHVVSAPGGPGGGFGGASDRIVAGQASLIALDGWTVEEMVVEPSVGMIVEWPIVETRVFDPSTFRRRARPYREARREHDEKVRRLDEWVEAARHYRKAAAAGSVERDLALEAFARVVAGELPALVVAQREREIREAVEHLTAEGLRVVLAGGAEAYRVADLLKEKNVPVILGPTQRLPLGEDDPYDAPFTNPKLLYEAGVPFAFATFDAADARTLPYEAGNAVGYGLPWEEALRAITIRPAEILGVSDRLGTIEPGKLANLIVTDGDPLEIRTQIREVIVRGRPVGTENKHRRLYERYRARP